MAKNIDHVLATPGRFKQSVAQSSFDAWTKYYKQDENSLNAIISYYVKGAVVALCLDLYIRQHSAYSLDDLMRYLWQHFGKNFYPDNQHGLSEDAIESILLKAFNLNINDFVADYVYGCKELPLTQLLQAHGYHLSETVDKKKPVSLGIRTKNVAGQVQITAVAQDSMAHQAGLSAQDVIVAIDGLRVHDDNLNRLLSAYTAGDSLTIHVFRLDTLYQFTVKTNDAHHKTHRIIKN